MTEGSVNTDAVESTEEEDQPINKMNLPSQVEVYISFLEDIFLLSSTKDKENHFFLAAYRDVSQENISKNDMIRLVVERLWAEEELEIVLKVKPKLANSQAYETDPMKYLAECHARLQSKSDEKHRKLDDFATCSTIIKEQAILLFEVPSQLEDFSPTKHLLSLLRSNDESVTEHLKFYAELVDQMKNKEITWLLEKFQPLLSGLLKKVKGYRLSFESTFPAESFRFPVFLNFFARNETLATMFLEYDRFMTRQADSFEESLLGNLLALGPNPKYFSVPSDCLGLSWSVLQSTIDDLKSQVHKFMDVIQHGLYNFFNKVLKFKNEVKKALLSWIGDALHFYKDRNELWNIHLEPTIFPDNFLINLQNILLKVFEPFLEDHSKLLDIQHTYCWATKSDDALHRNVHMKEIRDKYLIPLPSGEGLLAQSLEDDYKMCSEVFFMTHNCFHLAFSLIHEKFTKLNQEMGQIRERYRELLKPHIGDVKAKLLALKVQFQNALPLSWYYKIVLQHPHTLEKSFELVTFTAKHLVHVAMTPPGNPAPTNVNSAIFPPPPHASGALLRFIPELLPHNVHSYLMYLREYKDDFFKNQEEWKHLRSIFDYLLLFMSNPHFIHDPCTRAGLAEDLDCFIPKWVMPNSDNGAQLLVKYPNAHNLMAGLMQFLVGMGQARPEMDTENPYRFMEPIRDMFRYLCNCDLHSKALRELVEAADHSLFLKFSYVLTRNVIYFLDGCLEAMIQVRYTTSDCRLSQIPEFLRKEVERKTREARSFNNLCIATLEILVELMDIVGSSLSHVVEAALIAVMADYCLPKFFGPKKENLIDYYEFLINRYFKPEVIWNMILSICTSMWRNEVFLRILSRCYNSCDLLPGACDTFLGRYSYLKHVADRINEIATMEAEEWDRVRQFTGDDLLDRITETLARDPVRLPSDDVVGVWTIINYWLGSGKDDNPFILVPMPVTDIIPDDITRNLIEVFLAAH